MSNHLVGSIYSTVIEEVINSSRVDFEEAGVNSLTLDDLKKVWQNKLSDLKVAHFPWDPPVEAPAPPQMARPGPPGPQQPHIKPDPGTIHGQQVHYQNNGVRIKTEPGMDNHHQQIYIPQPMSGNTNHDPQLAAMRAQQNIQAKFGVTAPQLQARPIGGLVLPGMNPQQNQYQQNLQPMQQQPQQVHIQQQPQQQPHHQHQLPQQQQQQQHQQQQQQQQRPPSQGIPQHDGADDCNVLIPVENFGNITREEADRILLHRIHEAERQSLKQTQDFAAALQSLKSSKKSGKAPASSSGSSGPSTRRRRAKKMDAYAATLDGSTNFPYPSASFAESGLTATGPPVIPQGDAPADDEEDDEDAINSDLDDPDEAEIDNDEDEEGGQIMLCMYDKVQRTKNKWKCVLKDGVLTINGQDYVFHKANGEYEW